MVCRTPSETGLDNAKFDYELDSNGTINELIGRVEKILILSIVWLMGTLRPDFRICLERIYKMVFFS
jgi:hypothetical protein